MKNVTYQSNKFIIRLLNNLIDLPQSIRKLILILLDILSIGFSVELSLWLTANTSYLNHWNQINILNTILILIGIIIYIFTGRYKGLTRYFDGVSTYIIIKNNFIYLFFSAGIIYILNINIIPIKFWVSLWLILSGSNYLVRATARYLMCFSNNKLKKRKKVGIYGAGSAGVQLANSLDFSDTYIINSFFDDNPSLWGREISNVKISSSKAIKDFVRNRLIDVVLLAMPSISQKKRIDIIKYIQKFGVPVLYIPSVDEITSGKITINTLESLSIESLLGRDEIDSNYILSTDKITNKNICVTGAGGSIGSELCRQIIKYHPNKLILFEISESNLYLINQELKEENKTNIEILPIIGSLTNENLVKYVFSNYNINNIFHAAAYKHVPLLEENPIEGIKNNVLASNVICKVADDLSIENVTLISSDKAVRPTNIMGSTKRISELIFKYYSQKVSNSKTTSQKIKTKYSMVRFGNVLGSSGSVVPLFEKQISDGGPVTVTHPEMIRYFMTISEAVSLVLHANSMAQGGELFILDMGDPVKIVNLAKQMIGLKGLTIKDKQNKNGDIEIIYTGLRPGEKLYEELITDGFQVSTRHPSINKANESDSLPSNFYGLIDDLENEIKRYDLDNIINLVKILVPESSLKKSYITRN